MDTNTSKSGTQCAKTNPWPPILDRIPKAAIGPKKNEFPLDSRTYPANELARACDTKEKISERSSGRRSNAVLLEHQSCRGLVNGRQRAFNRMIELLNNETLKFLDCTRLPARVTGMQAAAILGCNEHDIPVLLKAKLLVPLGKPKPNASKHFATVTLQELAQDTVWLAKATNALYDHWSNQNRKRSGKRDKLKAAA